MLQSKIRVALQFQRPGRFVTTTAGPAAGRVFLNFIGSIRPFHHQGNELMNNKKKNSMKKGKNSLFESFTEQYQDIQQEEEKEVVIVPESVKEEFYLKYEALSKNLAGDDSPSSSSTASVPKASKTITKGFSSKGEATTLMEGGPAKVKGVSGELTANTGFPLILDLIAALKTKEETELLRGILEMWVRANRIFTRGKSVQILDALLAKKDGQLHSLIFDILCNKSVYALKPDCGHISKLLKHFAALSILPSLDDATRLENLDFAYKSFALYIYYDYPPTVTSYNILIAAGLYGGLEEGRKRSKMTLDELNSFGWKTTPDADYSWLYLDLKEKRFEDALLKIEKLTTSTHPHGLLFEAEALIGLSNFTKAKESLSKYQKLPEGFKKEFVFGNINWRSSDELNSLVNQ